MFFYFSLRAMTDFSDISIGNSQISSGAKQLKIIRKKKAMKIKSLRFLLNQH